METENNYNNNRLPTNRQVKKQTKTLVDLFSPNPDLNPRSQIPQCSDKLRRQDTEQILWLQKESARKEESVLKKFRNCKILP